MQRPLAHHEGSLRAVHTGRHIGQFQPLLDLFKIYRQFICQVNIAIHHARHELDRVIGFQPRGLIADHRIGRRVGFVEAVIGEFIQKVPDLQRDGIVHPVFARALDEFRAFGIHRLLNFFTHGAAQEISTAQRITRHFLRDLHHLFLIDDNALGLIQNVIHRRVQIIALGQAVFHLAIFRDILHRAGAVERHERHDILNACRLHPLQGIHHARAFHLKHRHGFGAGIQRVGGRIIQRDCADIVLRPRRGRV